MEYFAAIDCRWVVSGENEICTLPRSSQACILYPSNLISCSQSGPSGALSTSLASCGLIQVGGAAGSAPRRTGAVPAGVVRGDFAIAAIYQEFAFLSGTMSRIGCRRAFKRNQTGASGRSDWRYMLASRDLTAIDTAQIRCLVASQPKRAVWVWGDADEDCDFIRGVSRCRCGLDGNFRSSNSATTTDHTNTGS